MSDPPLAPPDYLSPHVGRSSGMPAGQTRSTWLRVPPAPRPGRLVSGTAAKELGERDRRVLLDGVRHRGLTAWQAWQWYWPTATTDKRARNRLAELAGAGLLVNVDRGRGQDGLYVPTRAAATLLQTLGLTELAPPTVPAGGQLSKVAHDLTVADVAHWLLGRSVPGASWLTWRELARETMMALPPARRRGGASVRFLPDGCLVLPDGDRMAVEVELTDKRQRLAGKVAWYADELNAGRLAAVLWLARGTHLARGLGETLRAGGLADPEVAWAETLPSDLRTWEAPAASKRSVDMP